MKVITTVTDPSAPNFGQVTELDLPDPPTSPRVLFKTAFQDYAVSQLGGSVTGMGRFIEIMDATRDSVSAAARFAYARYEAANTFEKSNVELLTGVMEQAGAMLPDERTAIVDNWPEG